MIEYLMVDIEIGRITSHKKWIIYIQSEVSSRIKSIHADEFTLPVSNG